jgi:hypothetical protein
MEMSQEELQDLRKLKRAKAIRIREILNKRQLDEFELDLIMNDLI